MDDQLTSATGLGTRRAPAPHLAYSLDPDPEPDWGARPASTPRRPVPPPAPPEPRSWGWVWQHTVALLSSLLAIAIVLFVALSILVAEVDRHADDANITPPSMNPVGTWRH